jgi:hypothetical protein
MGIITEGFSNPIIGCLPGSTFNDGNPFSVPVHDVIKSQQGRGVLIIEILLKQGGNAHGRTV